MPNYGVNPNNPSNQPTGGNNTSSPTSDTLLNTLGYSVAPQTANAQLQYNLGQAQIGETNTAYQNALTYNQANAQNQLSGLGISAQQNTLQQQGLQQQGAQAQAQQGFEQQQYGIQQGQYPEQQAEATLAYQNALQQTQGQQAIGGTQNTVGGRANVNTLGQQYGFQLQDIARNQSLSQLGQQSEQSQYGYSQQQLQNAQQNLGLIAKANGLSQQQVYTMLNYGNQQAATGAEQSVVSQLANLGNIESGNISNAGAALSQAGFRSGINALAGTG